MAGISLNNTKYRDMTCLILGILHVMHFNALNKDVDGASVLYIIA